MAVIALELIICMPIIKNKNKKVYNDFNGYMYLCTHLLLYIFTFGIWELIWITKTTKYINSVSDEKMSVAGNVLLCLFIPYYFVAWNNKIGRRLDKYACENGVDSIIAPTCIFLSFFNNIAVSVLIQAKINETVYVFVKNKKIDNGEIIDTENVSRDNTFLTIKLILHSVLVFVTCGVWQFIWIYKFTNRINAIDSKNRYSAVAELFLCIFVPYYIIVWNCKMAKKISRCAENAYTDSDIVSTIMVSSFLSPTLVPILLQYKMNSLCAI